MGQAALARAVTRSRLVRTLDRAFDEAGEAIEEFIDRGASSPSPLNILSCGIDNG